MNMEMESQQQENEEEISDDYRSCGGAANASAMGDMPPPNDGCSENDESGLGNENENSAGMAHANISPHNEPQRPDGTLDFQNNSNVEINLDS